MEMHIRRLIQTLYVATAIAAVALTPPAGAAGGQPRYDQHHLPAAPVPVSELSPVERVIRQEDARRNDPRIFGTQTSDAARPVVQIVASGGFQWADAGVGAGAAFGLVLAALGGTVLIWGRRFRRA
jgi:hypothetical protein